MADVIKKYSEHPESKSLAPGSPCSKHTTGLLRRRPVIAKPTFKFIGKEVDRGTSEDAYMLQGDKLTRYSAGEISPFPKELTTMSDREIARRTGLDAESISRMRSGQNTRSSTQVKLMKFARTIPDETP